MDVLIEHKRHHNIVIRLITQLFEVPNILSTLYPKKKFVPAVYQVTSEERNMSPQRL